MKIISLTVLFPVVLFFAASPRSPVMAQAWTGTPTIYNSAGNSSFYRNGTDTSCVSPTGVASAAPCAPGTNLISGGPNGSALPLAALPTGSESVDAGLSVFATGTIPNSTCPSGYCVLSANIPLRSFANSDAIDNAIAGVQTSLNGFQSSVNQSIVQLQSSIQTLGNQSAQYAAMAAAMQTMSPANGLQNRIGFNVSTAWGRQAVSGSYVHTAGDVDLHVAAAMSGSLAMGHVGIGFSW